MFRCCGYFTRSLSLASRPRGQAARNTKIPFIFVLQSSLRRPSQPGSEHRSVDQPDAQPHRDRLFPPAKERSARFTGDNLNTSASIGASSMPEWSNVKNFLG